MLRSMFDSARGRLLRLTAVLFLSYLCVAIALPIIPVFVTGRLGLANAWGGLGIGVAFFATIATRGYAGSLTDRHGAKSATVTGLLFYAAGGAALLGAGMFSEASVSAYAVLVIGRLVIGLGESLVGVGVIAWGIDLAGPARSGQVLSLVGAAIYGALAVGAPIGMMLLERFGFAGAAAVGIVLPCLGLIAVVSLEGGPAHPDAERPPLRSVIGAIWRHGAVVGLQGVGFAAIGAFFVLHFLDRHWSYAGLGLSAFGAGFVLMRLAFGWLPDRSGGLPVAIGSLIVEIAGQILIGVATDPAIALAGAFLTGLGCSMIFPAMGREVVHRIAPHLRATALGGYSAFQDLAYGLTGPLAGLLADTAGYGSVFLIGAVAAAVGLVIALSLHRAPRTVTP